MATAKKTPETRIKEVREERHLSQHQLARLVGIDASQISRYEQGRAMSDAVIKKIIKALDLKAEYFLKLYEDDEE